MSENQEVGILLETFGLEAYKFAPKDERANVKLEIISGKIMIIQFILPSVVALIANLTLIKFHFIVTSLLHLACLFLFYTFPSLSMSWLGSTIRMYVSLIHLANFKSPH